MQIDRKIIKIIIILVTISALIFLGLQNINVVVNALFTLIGLFLPFFIGLIIAFILNVPLRFIERLLTRIIKSEHRIWIKLKRPVSLLITYLFVSGLAAVLLVSVIPEIGRTIEILSENFPRYLEASLNWVKNMLIELDIYEDNIKNVQINWDKLFDGITSFMTTGSAQIFNTTVDITTTIVGGVFNFIMSIIFSIHALLNKERLARQVKKVMYAYLPENAVLKILDISSLTSNIFSRYVTGQVIEAAILGILCFIGMTILSMPYAMMISVLIGFFNLIPVFGAIIGTGIGAFLIMMVDPMKALWFIIFIIILQQIENNLIFPKVVGNSIGLPGMWVLLAALVGGNIYGALGVLISVPLSSVLYYLLRDSVYKNLKVRNITHNPN